MQRSILISSKFVSLSAVKVPICVLGAEIDRMSPPELLKQFEEALAAKPEVVKTGQTISYDVSFFTVQIF